MPRLDGLDATRRMLAERSQPRVIVLTTFDEDEYVYEAISAGASGFLLKDLRRRAADRRHPDRRRGRRPARPRRHAAADRALLRRAATADGLPESMAELTARELEVLKLVARGLSNRQIAESLFLSEATVKSHLAHVYAKLSVRDRVQAVVLAYETGLVEPGADPAI